MILRNNESMVGYVCVELLDRGYARQEGFAVTAALSFDQTEAGVLTRLMEVRYE
tara:strand:- start:792 stop:953 length:162 start_codon:yes stop_codon:yes gene_type:complete